MGRNKARKRAKKAQEEEDALKQVNPEEGTRAGCREDNRIVHLHNRTAGFGDPASGRLLGADGKPATIKSSVMRPADRQTQREKKLHKGIWAFGQMRTKELAAKSNSAGPPSSPTPSSGAPTALEGSSHYEWDNASESEDSVNEAGNGTPPDVVKGIRQQKGEELASSDSEIKTANISTLCGNQDFVSSEGLAAKSTSELHEPASAQEVGAPSTQILPIETTRDDNHDNLVT
jgi:hypothetical protein